MSAPEIHGFQFVRTDDLPWEEQTMSDFGAGGFKAGANRRSRVAALDDGDRDSREGRGGRGRMGDADRPRRARGSLSDTHPRGSGVPLHPGGRARPSWTASRAGLGKRRQRGDGGRRRLLGDGLSIRSRRSGVTARFRWSRISVRAAGSVLRVLGHRAQLDADPRTGLRHLRHGVLPRLLAASSHDEEIPPAGLEGA